MINTALNINPFIHVPALKLAKGAWSKGQPRFFTVHIEPHEQDAILHIIKTLSEKSLKNLLKEKNQLNKRGEELEHVHPLTFFIGVLSHHCGHHFRDLKRRGGIPYDEFLKGAIKSFKEEHQHNNLTDQQIQEFANITGKCIHQTRRFIQSHDWPGFINWLASH